MKSHKPQKGMFYYTAQKHLFKKKCDENLDILLLFALFKLYALSHAFTPVA